MKKMNGYAVKRNQTKQGILVLYTIQYLYGNHFQNPTKESTVMNDDLLQEEAKNVCRK